MKTFLNWITLASLPIGALGACPLAGFFTATAQNDEGRSLKAPKTVRRTWNVAFKSERNLRTSEVEAAILSNTIVPAFQASGESILGRFYDNLLQAQ